MDNRGQGAPAKLLRVELQARPDVAHRAPPAAWSSSSGIPARRTCHCRTTRTSPLPRCRRASRCTRPGPASEPADTLPRVRIGLLEVGDGGAGIGTGQLAAHEHEDLRVRCPGPRRPARRRRTRRRWPTRRSTWRRPAPACPRSSAPRGWQNACTRRPRPGRRPECAGPLGPANTYFMSTPPIAPAATTAMAPSAIHCRRSPLRPRRRPTARREAVSSSVSGRSMVRVKAAGTGSSVRSRSAKWSNDVSSTQLRGRAAGGASMPRRRSAGDRWTSGAGCRCASRRRPARRTWCGPCRARRRSCRSASRRTGRSAAARNQSQSSRTDRRCSESVIAVAGREPPPAGRHPPAATGCRAGCRQTGAPEPA